MFEYCGEDLFLCLESNFDYRSYRIVSQLSRVLNTFVYSVLMCSLRESVPMKHYVLANNNGATFVFEPGASNHNDRHKQK